MVYKPSSNRYKIYDKGVLKTFLPSIVLLRCFEVLCEKADNHLSIIPVPELIIHTNGVYQIHDSFIFKVSSSRHINWFWESSEEAKATYIFQTPNQGFEQHLQEIYDYLTGDMPNKRETLIRSPRLKSQLGFVKRIRHNDFSQWKNELTWHS